MERIIERNRVERRCQGSRQGSVLNKVVKEDFTEEKSTFEQGHEEGEGEVTWRSGEASGQEQRDKLKRGMRSHYGLYLCSDEKPLENFETPITPFKIVNAV